MIHSGFPIGVGDARYVLKSGDTMTGALTLANLTDAIKSGDYALQFKSYKTDGAGVSAYVFDTNASFIGASAKPYKFKIAGVEAAWFDGSKGAFGGDSNIVTAGYAFGQSNAVSASYATASGYANTCSGNGAVGLGLQNIVAGLYGVGIGQGNTVPGLFSVGIGAGNIAGTSSFTAGWAIGGSVWAVGGASAGLGTYLNLIGMNSYGFGAGGANKLRTTRNNSVVVGVGNDYPAFYMELAKRSFINMPNFGVGYSGSVGSELLTNGTFTGSAAGWTVPAGMAYSANTVVKNADGTGALTQALTNMDIGGMYVITYSITVHSAGTVVLSLPSNGITFNYQDGNYTATEVFMATSATDTLTFTPSNTARFTIDTISLKKITGGDLAVAGTGYINTALSIGGATSTNLLDIAAGTTTKAQLHFESSTLKTTPVAGDMEYSAGHWYITNGARHAITASAGVKTSTTTVANTVTETVLYTYTFAAGELHADEYISFDMSGVVSNASAADDYTIRVKFGGVTLHTINRVGGNVTNTGWSTEHQGTIRTAGASGTFVDHIKWSEGSLTDEQGDTTTHAVDTTASQTFEVTVQWAAAKAGNTISCTQGRLIFNH